MEGTPPPTTTMAMPTTSSPSRSDGPRIRSPPFPSRAGKIALVAATLFICPAAAARVDFRNCLSDTYVNNKNPVLLQWVPAYVDASFDTQSPDHTIRVTMYGNVTGTRTNDPLPPWDSPDWLDPNKTDGKILRSPEPDSEKPKLTTLHSQIDVLSYEPWNTDTDFCNVSLTNATCPLAPVFNKTAM